MKNRIILALSVVTCLMTLPQGAFSQSSSSASSVSSSSVASLEASAARIDLQPDRDEAMAGDPLRYVIAVENLLDQPLENLQVEFTFPTNQLGVADPGGGILSDDTIVWSLSSLPARQATTIAFGMQLQGAERAGSRVETTAELRQADRTVVGRQRVRDTHELMLITGLPSTGFFSGNDDAGSPFLRPAAASENGLGAVAIILAAMLGLAAGGVAMFGILKRTRSA